jgi:glycosyltransferase involved in cell wall biosynthesis
VFHDGVNALLYTPGDENQMADSMVRLIKDKELRAALSRNGVSTAQALTWAASAERTLTVYEEACGDNAARRVHR